MEIGVAAPTGGDGFKAVEGTVCTMPHSGHLAWAPMAVAGTLSRLLHLTH